MSNEKIAGDKDKPKCDPKKRDFTTIGALIGAAVIVFILGGFITAVVIHSGDKTTATPKLKTPAEPDSKFVAKAKVEEPDELPEAAPGKAKYVEPEPEKAEPTTAKSSTKVYKENGFEVEVTDDMVVVKKEGKKLWTEKGEGKILNVDFPRATRISLEYADGNVTLFDAQTGDKKN